MSDAIPEELVCGRRDRFNILGCSSVIERHCDQSTCRNAALIDALEEQTVPYAGDNFLIYRINETARIVGRHFDTGDSTTPVRTQQDLINLVELAI